MHWDHRIGRRLKLRDLNILLAVADAGSMAKAATRLAISQPAVSRAIADMEHTLGVTLLDRSPQGVEPTQYGRAILKRGIAAFNELKQGVQDIAFLSDPGAGELRIGANATLSEGIVAAVIDRLSQQYPRVAFHVIVGGTLALLEGLRARHVELGFARLSKHDAEGDANQEVLFEEPLVVVAGLDSPWVRRRKIKLAELVNEHWTWPASGTLFDTLVVEAFRNSGVEPPSGMVHADPVNMRIKLAATGRFLAVVPASIVEFPAKHAAIRKLPVALGTTQRPTGIITLKNRTLSALAQRFIECAREVAKPLAKSQAPSGRAKNISARNSQAT
jgi:DNA-binding transcriptional LysR family regulator